MNRLLNHNSSWHCFRSIIQTEGILSFASGVKRDWRSGGGNGNYLIVWYTKKNVLPLDDNVGKIKTMPKFCLWLHWWHVGYRHE